MISLQTVELCDNVRVVIMAHQYKKPGNNSLRFPTNSEANASEFVGNLEELLIKNYYIYTDFRWTSKYDLCII